MKLISLQGDRRSYIYLGKTNGANLLGFEIYRLVNNKLEILESSASVTGVGNDELTDADHNGMFDGYTQFRSSYDVYYYDVTARYLYKNGAFAFSDAQVDPSEYPDSIDAVISQYVTLRLLWERYDYKLGNAYERLSALCQSESLLKVPWDNDSWGAFFASQQNFDEGKVQIEQTEDKAVAAIAYTDDDTHKVTTLKFQLIKTDGKWQIVNIKETK